MDHRQLYKTSGISNLKQIAKDAAARKRTESRQTQFASHRNIPDEETTNDPTQKTSSSDPNLTKSQRYLLKFYAWQQERQANKAHSIKRPFVTAVPKNVFISPQIANIPRNHKFRPPPNLPQLVLKVFDDKHRTSTINEKIITRSMSAANKDSTKKASVPQKKVIL